MNKFTSSVCYEASLRFSIFHEFSVNVCNSKLFPWPKFKIQKRLVVKNWNDFLLTFKIIAHWSRLGHHHHRRRVPIPWWIWIHLWCKASTIIYVVVLYDAFASITLFRFQNFIFRFHLILKMFQKLSHSFALSIVSIHPLNDGHNKMYKTIKFLSCNRKHGESEIALVKRRRI